LGILGVQYRFQPDLHRSAVQRRCSRVSPLRVPLVLCLLAVLPAATCGSQYRLPACAQQTTAPLVELPAGTQRLEVQFHDGLLTLETGPLSCELQIHLVADAPATVAQLASEVLPSMEVSGQTTKLQVSVPAGASLDAVRTTWRLRAPAGTAVVARTRRGAVVARGAACNLEVHGGSGVIEAQMAGGSAQLTSSSGSVILRGDYPFADVRSELGRIDLRLPDHDRRDCEVRVVSKNDVYIDLHRTQLFDFLYFGEERLVHCDPEVRVQWQRNETVDGVDYLRGRLGDLAGERGGQLRLDAMGPVYVRLQPEGAVAAN
jgi:hypothetical protein